MNRGVCVMFNCQNSSEIALSLLSISADTFPHNHHGQLWGLFPFAAGHSKRLCILQSLFVIIHPRPNTPTVHVWAECRYILLGHAPHPLWSSWVHENTPLLFISRYQYHVYYIVPCYQNVKIEESSILHKKDIYLIQRIIIDTNSTYYINFESTGFKVNYSISCFLSLLLGLSFGVLGFLARRAASRFILALSK